MTSAIVFSPRGRFAAVLEPRGGVVYRIAKIEEFSWKEYGFDATPICPLSAWPLQKDSFLRLGNIIIERD